MTLVHICLIWREHYWRGVLEVPEGPKFSCPQCGKVYPWKAELAGKKGKCKCGAVMHVPTSSEGVAARVASKKSANGSKGGSSVMNTSAHVASRPRPTPKPVAVEEPQEAHEGNGEVVEEDVVAPPPYSADAVEASGVEAVDAVDAPPPYSPGAVATAAPAAKGTAFAPAAVTSDATTKQPLRWAPALKWLGIGAALLAWSVFEFIAPDDHVRGRGLRIIVALANNIIPHGGAILLGLVSGFFLVMGVLILLGKTKDSDYEQKQKENAWPGSRGRK
jgi:hypothetical protein